MSRLLFRAYAVALLSSAVLGVNSAFAEESGKAGTPSKVLADSGFRPKPNGFGFENWGGDQYPVSNLTADEAALLFGDRVCARFNGDSCVPTAATKLWLSEMNQMMQGGRCEGMAALSAAFHVKVESVGDFGARQPFELKPSEAGVMRTISTYFVTQALEPVQSTAATSRGWSLQQIVDQLVKSLLPGGDYMTLGIFSADGGHAVTPYKVEERGVGLYRVYVYDNNYPGAEKYIDIDVRGDRWVYAGAALNPREDPAPWEGGAGAMDLTPLSVRYEPLACPFCGDHVAPKRPKAPKTPQTPQKPRKPSVASSDYIAFTPARCSQLQATRKSDKKQLTAGKNGAKNELGKASMVALRGARGCVVRLPRDQRYDLSIRDDGRPSRRPDTGLVIFSPGNVYSVSQVMLSPTTTQLFTFDNGNFAYQAGGNQKPTLRIAGDGAGRNTLYEVTNITLSDGRTFGATEDDTGKITFHDDDPSLDGYDISAEVIDENETEMFDLDNVDVGDNGDVVLEVDDEGRLDVDIDSDGDGTVDDADTDDDNDGTLDAQDADDDNDGVADDKEGKDSDGDSIPDSVDNDDDNDGELDAADPDGLTLDEDDVDTDKDGVVDEADTDDDNDGTADAADTDDDNDGVADTAEDDDADNDGTVDSADTDDDNDGTPDATDTDDDNDGVADTAEDDGAADGDEGASNEADDDADNDGTTDSADTDDDNDGTPDASDTDDDNDGVQDTDEGTDDSAADDDGGADDAGSDDGGADDAGADEGDADDGGSDDGAADDGGADDAGGDDGGADDSADGDDSAD